MLAFYGNPISEHLSDSPEGFLICRSVPIARIGKMEYLARELGLDGDPERLVTVNRYPEDVFSEAAIASFEGKDITDNHPPGMLDANSSSAFSRGHIQNVRRDGDNLVADLVIKDPALANDVRNGVKREVSCGYHCDFVPDGDGYKQINIRGNHVAVVPNGRAGAAISIQDSAEKARKGRKMSEKTKALLSFFGYAAKDADPEALSELTDNAAALLEAEPAPAQEAEPTADVKVESVPEGDDLGTKLDKVLERLTALEAMFKKEETDEEPELMDECSIDAVLEAGETQAEKEEAVTVPMDACTQDGGAAILKAMREAISKISSPEEKSAVVDALLRCTTKTGTMGEIMAATEANAKAAADAIPDTGKIMQEIDANYRSRNPHHKKED